MNRNRIQQQLEAIAMTTGREKVQNEHRYEFTITDGQSKIVPLYWQNHDKEGTSNSDFNLTSNYPAAEILWKSRCSGGYYYIGTWNTETNGALLGLTWLGLNESNFQYFDAVVDIPTKLNTSKTSVLSEIIQDTLKDDVKGRRFVPHVRHVPLPTKGFDFVDGNLPTGLGTDPADTPRIKALMISNLTPVTSSVTFQVYQNFFQYALPNTEANFRAEDITTA